MKRCLGPGQLLRLRSSWSIRLQTRGALGPGLRPWKLGQWRRSYASVAAGESPEDCLRRERPKPPVSGERQKDPQAWFSNLERLLEPLSSRAGAGVESKYSRAWDLAIVLSYARFNGHFDLLAQYGAQTGRWANVHALFGQMLDATEDLKAGPALPLAVADWGDVGELPLDEITSQSVCEDFGKVRLVSRDMHGKAPSIHELADRPYSTEFTQRVMSQAWQSLGAIVLQAASQPAGEEHGPAMACVFRILARLHHSGAISDNVYKSSPRLESNKATSRPPALHLLSTHIVSVLSEVAWQAHEAEVMAEAVAAGKESPYVPFKMNIRQLGPEIWLELILWCCVEQGYAREGLWIIEQMTKHTGDQAWRFESWDSLLRDPGLSYRKTKIDVEDYWRRGQGEGGKSSVFHGLGKLTISLEIISSLRDSLINLAYVGIGYRGLSPSVLLTYVSRFSALINAASDEPNDDPQPTTKDMNWLIARITESGGLDLNKDPQAFEAVLRATPYVMPPWDDRPSGFETDLEQLTPSQLYDETAAFTGLLEYTIRYYALEGKTGQAFKCFNWLQRVVDASKAQHVQAFMQRVGQPGRKLPQDDLMSPKALESSVPQVSNVTYAGLVELSTSNRTSSYGDWLLFSNDLDGPPIHPNEYGSQTLAPALIRFAATTQNHQLYQRVVTAIKQPFSLNTLRALITYRICTGDFARVVLMLEFIRDNRLKSWGHHNVMALAGVILRLHHSHEDGMARRAQTLSKAKDVLLRILNGEFNDLSERKYKSTFHHLALINIHRLFLSIPGPLSEIASQSRIHRHDQGHIINHNHQGQGQGHQTLPYIPDTAFTHLLTALVDTQGSEAGKALWEKWCLDTRPLASRLRREGGIVRLQGPDDPGTRVDSVRAARVFRKLVVPSLGTVRVIAQKAAEEFTLPGPVLGPAGPLGFPETSPVGSDTGTGTGTGSEAGAGTGAGTGTGTGAATGPGARAGGKTEAGAIDVLNFCVKQFRTLGLPDAEIDAEFMGYLGWLREKAARGERAYRDDRERIRRFLAEARFLD